MTPDATPPTTDSTLGAAHVLLTGGTGFVGQAVLERLLADHPDTRVTLLVRGKGSQTGEDRLRGLMRKPVFRAWRDRIGADAADRAVADRVRVVEGSLSRMPALPADLDVVIHSASTVSFDPPIDQAFDTNVGGATNLYEALAASGADPHVVHVSTCYVAGLRKGVVPEARLGHDVDWRAEYTAAAATRARVELASRAPGRLRHLIQEARAQHGKEGPTAVAAASESARVEWVTAQLVEAGRARAQSLGWTDVYTMTKAFAERAAEELWAARGHRLSVVRPSIIESAIAHPFPGWIDGFKVADPLILAYGRGQLPDFPGVPDSVLDIIPIDLVVNAILAVAAAPAPEPRYYQVASGASNPLPFHRMYANVREYFTANPVPRGDDDHIRVPTWEFPGDRSIERALRLAERLTDARERVLDRLPASERTRRWQHGVDRRRADLDVLRSLSKLYSAYTGTEVIFGDANLRALHAALPEGIRAGRGIDVTAIDWEAYLQGVHFPAITTLTRAYGRRGADARTPRPLPALPSAGADERIVAVFDLEGTVVKSNLVEQFLWVSASGGTGAGRPAELIDLATALPRYLRAERRDRGEFIRAFLRRYAGLPAHALEEAVRGGYTRRLLEKASADALARVDAHRAAGHRTVLVTGSIDVLASPLADRFDEVVASRMHAEDGRLTGYLDRPPLVDEARAAWLAEYARARGLDLAASYGYGDSHADLPWLGLLGNPAVVNPDARLSREASKRRWPIAAWR